MLDKGQIQGWEGEPEEQAKPSAAGAPRPGLTGAIMDSREALPTGERVTLSLEQTTARRRRGQWIALALFAFVILVFVLTMTKMGANILVRDL